MRKTIGIVMCTVAMALSVAAPAMADTLIGVNVCDVSVLVQYDDSSTGQCVNQ